jgi:hypothetical protein
LADRVARRYLLSALFLLVLTLLIVAALSWYGSIPRETMPGPGGVHLTSDPARAPTAMSIRYVGDDGTPSRVSDEFARGEPVVVDRSSLPGTYAIEVNGETCQGSFAITTDGWTDVVLVLTDAGCLVGTAE